MPAARDVPASGTELERPECSGHVPGPGWPDRCTGSGDPRPHPVNPTRSPTGQHTSSTQGPVNGARKGEKPQVNSSHPRSCQLFRKPMLYPLSYEGAAP
jgi:hypothetical protein